MVGATRIELVTPTMSRRKNAYLLSIIFFYLLLINGLFLRKIFTIRFCNHKLDFIDLQVTTLPVCYL